MLSKNKYTHTSSSAAKLLILNIMILIDFQSVYISRKYIPYFLRYFNIMKEYLQ